MRYRVKPIQHDAVRCPRTGSRTRYHSGGGIGTCHSAEFGCPTCGRTGYFNLNYLSNRHVMCDGQRFTKVKP